MSFFSDANGTPDGNRQAPVVLSVAFPFAVVGEAAVGGAEVVLSHLEAALPALGFRSVVVARAGSRPAGQLYATPVADGEIDDALRAAVEAAQQANLDRALAEHPVALVHLHGLDFDRYRLPADMPVVVTLHLPPGWYPETIWQLPENYHLVCVSETQRQACPAHARQRVEVIPNGVPLPDRGLLRPAGRYALMLARICPEKNLHTGFDAARLAGLPALLAGEVFPYPDHLRYFAEEIQPRLTAPGAEHMPRTHNAGAPPEARFLGPVTGAAKTRLLSRAACLLLPSLAPETSSMVAMEAMAAGIPVVAVASGAVPEIVDAGRTGLLVPPGGDIVSDLAAALGQLPSISRQLCRETAEQRFSLEHMLAAYAALFRRVHLLSPLPRQPEDRSGLAGSERTVRNDGPDTSDENPVTTSLVVGQQALEAMEAAWAELWRADPTATPFGHPAWLLPWTRQFGPDGVVQAITQRGRAGRLLGLLPLFSYRDAETQVRKLLLLGAGTTDYLGGMFLPSHTPSLGPEALRFALEGQGIAGVLDFTQLRVDSPLLAAAAGLPLERGVSEPCAVLPVSRPLPPKVGANVRRYRRRAEGQGELTCTVAETVPEALAAFTTLARLHGGRWEAREQEGVLADPRVLGHHREAVPALLAAGLLRLFTLRCGADTLAVLYALADPPERPNRRLYLYLIGIDMGRSDLSPGSLLLHAVWEYARRESFTHLDLLRGGEAYKSLWGAEPEGTFTLHAVPAASGTPRGPHSS